MGINACKLKDTSIILKHDYNADNKFIDIKEYTKKDRKILKRHNTDINYLLHNKTNNDLLYLVCVCGGLVFI